MVLGYLAVMIFGQAVGYWFGWGRGKSVGEYLEKEKLSKKLAEAYETKDKKVEIEGFVLKFL